MLEIKRGDKVRLIPVEEALETWADKAAARKYGGTIQTVGYASYGYIWCECGLSFFECSIAEVVRDGVEVFNEFANRQ